MENTISNTGASDMMMLQPTNNRTEYLSVKMNKPIKSKSTDKKVEKEIRVKISEST